MLQAAFGGYKTVKGDNIFTDAPNTYHEPSFDIMFPLDLQSPKAQKIYILLRIRTDNTGNNFEAGTADPGTRFTSTIINGTTGDILTSSIKVNSLNTPWNVSSFNPYVLTIESDKSVVGSDVQVDVLDCIVRDDDTKSFISFRIKVLNSNTAFNFLTVFNKSVHTRPTSSTFGATSVVRLSKHGSYSLLSPITSFQEGKSTDATFSYPDSTIFYQREEAVNDEAFEFSITDSSTSVIVDNVKIFPVPAFHKAAVLQVDGKLQDELFTLKDGGWVDIQAVGKISDVPNLFRMYLVPSLGGIRVKSL